MGNRLRRIAATTLLAALAGMVLGAPAAPAAPPDYTTSEAGNPFADGWYADPDTVVYGDRYWVFPTTSKSYAEQTYLDAFSSTDLVNWTKHANVLTKANVSWASYAMWAPAPIQRNGKYYLYFAANDIQNNAALGGIGVAVATQPQGPYADALGRPLIAQFQNGAQPIDQDVFIDDDGQAYMFYGGWGHANVVKINADMISLGTHVDGSVYKEITPAGYVEGPQMFKRNGKYYLMWSEGGWTGPDYSVAYAIANSPLGPFTRLGKVLAQDAAVARGSGHNSVVNIPGTDTWYIVYHRRPLSETDGNHRQLAYDRMVFNADGTIAPVTMRVRDNFADNNALGWRTYGGSWSATGGRYTAANSLGGKALLDTNFGDFTYDADVAVTSGGGDAGLLFRTTNAAVGTDSYTGYYAGISPAGRVVLGRVNNNWTQLQATAMTVAVGTTYRLRVTAVGSSIKVYVGDMATPKINVTDATYPTGANGVRVFNAAAAFDNVAVSPPAVVGTNFALGRPATGTAACAASEGPEKAVNGTVNGGNADKFCSAVSGAWLRVDLGVTRAINRFEVAHAQAGGESAALNTKAFTISVSADGVTWAQAVNVTANTAATSTHAVNVTGRYVRLNVGTPTQGAEIATRIYELRAFG
ncbi:family 43 glycosylhydrolase [Catellatospora vulcania]|uniref:family 43 glycosylhydrolase n=1 Tax=Catellatospora vulcania TaxID=1460450 RepID=UPI0018AFD66F|nr:family 43 glycosylhydrolase [Catellatospora vulcania]